MVVGFLTTQISFRLVDLRLILIMVVPISSYLVGQVVVIFPRSLVLRVYHLMLVYVVVVDLDSLEHLRLTLLYYNQVTDSLDSIVEVQLELVLLLVVTVDSLHSLVVLSLLPSIQQRQRCYSPLLENIKTLDLPLVLIMEMVVSLMSLVEKKEEPILMLDLVRLNYYPENQNSLNLQMRSIQKITTSVRLFHQ